MSAVSSIALSGLTAASARQNTSAHNIANVNTEGFKPHGGENHELRGGGVIYTPTAPQQTQPTYTREGQLIASGTDITRETVEQLGAAQAFKANLAVLKTDDEMQRSLLDIKA